MGHRLCIHSLTKLVIHTLACGSAKENHDETLSQCPFFQKGVKNIAGKFKLILHWFTMSAIKCFEIYIT